MPAAPTESYWRRSNANPERLRQRLEQMIPADRSGCWTWTGARLKNGYGVVRNTYGGPGNRRLYVHRAAYEMFRGPIGEDMQIDHLCRNRACFNPEHLQPVTGQINFIRGNHTRAVARRAGRCVKGLHEMTEDNVRTARNGDRRCRACHLAWQRSSRAARRATRSAVAAGAAAPDHQR